MKLRFTVIEGYVSTVEAVINYTGLADQIEGIATNPFDTDSGLPEINPLSTVPTLIKDDGEVLYGGPVLYEYLDSLHGKPRLFPDGGDRLWTVRRQFWLADALFDLAVRLVLESYEPAETHRAHYVERQWAKMMRAFDQFERDAGGFAPQLDIAQVRLVGAIAFIEPRIEDVLGKDLEWIDPGYEWREGRAALAAWYGKTSSDPIFNTNFAASS